MTRDRAGAGCGRLGAETASIQRRIGEKGERRIGGDDDDDGGCDDDDDDGDGDDSDDGDDDDGGDANKVSKLGDDSDTRSPDGRRWKLRAGSNRMHGIMYTRDALRSLSHSLYAWAFFAGSPVTDFENLFRSAYSRTENSIRSISCECIHVEVQYDNAHTTVFRTGERGAWG
jgi:hypothetical protein